VVAGLIVIGSTYRAVPQDSGKFARDSGDSHRCALAFGDKTAVSRTQSGLCLPGNVPHLLRKLLLATSVRLTDARRVTVRPGRLR
jgi:hypothetical protein